MIDHRAYQQTARHQTNACAVHGCQREPKKRGYCETHYAQITRYGKIKHIRTDPNEVEIIGGVAYITIYDKHHDPISSRVLVDAESLSIIGSRRIVVSENKGLLRVFISDKESKKNIKLSRLIMNAPEEMDVDHINRNPLDNRKCNLRVCDRTQNNANRNKRGYSIHSQNKTYSVEIQKYGKRTRVHGIKTEEEAKDVREKLEKKIFGEYAVNRRNNAASNPS